jgi:hypothetical protein
MSEAEYKRPKMKNDAWVPQLYVLYGEEVAEYFRIGAQTLLLKLQYDLADLKKLPENAVLSDLDRSFLKEYLPDQFDKEFTLSFLERFEAEAKLLIQRGQSGLPLYSQNVAQDVIYYMIYQYGKSAHDLDLIVNEIDDKEAQLFYIFDDWLEDVLEEYPDESDLMYVMSDKAIVDSKNEYHISHWFDPVYWQHSLPETEYLEYVGSNGERLDISSEWEDSLEYEMPDYSEVEFDDEDLPF